jgi:hypothetical protein
VPDVWQRDTRRNQAKTQTTEGIALWLCDELDKVERENEKAHDHMAAKFENAHREHERYKDQMNARFWQLMVAVVTMLLGVIGALLIATGGGG